VTVALGDKGSVGNVVPPKHQIKSAEPNVLENTADKTISV